MGGGGKGGSQTTKVEIPAWLESAARKNIAKAESMSQVGYVPYYGNDVAAMTPLQNAAIDSTNAAAGAFGMPKTASATDGMPRATVDANGVAGYSSGTVFDNALNELRTRRPGQYQAIADMYIDPVTGKPPTRQPYTTQAQDTATAAAAQPATPTSPFLTPERRGLLFGGRDK